MWEDPQLLQNSNNWIWTPTLIFQGQMRLGLSPVCGVVVIQQLSKQRGGGYPNRRQMVTMIPCSLHPPMQIIFAFWLFFICRHPILMNFNLACKYNFINTTVTLSSHMRWGLRIEHVDFGDYPNIVSQILVINFSHQYTITTYPAIQQIKLQSDRQMRWSTLSSWAPVFPNSPQSLSKHWTDGRTDPLPLL